MNAFLFHKNADLTFPFFAETKLPITVTAEAVHFYVVFQIKW